MDRLIDADELLARIRLNYNNHQNISAGAMKDIINTTPTAYDVEKVVAELDNAESVKVFGSLNSGNRLIPVSDAIDIVKRGGVG